MFAKTVCKPGSHICVVPLGLRATLQYNANGVIEKIFSGYEEDRTNISDKVLANVKKSKIIPNTVPTKGGTTWVEGAFYTDKQFDAPGVLPQCIEPSIIADMSDSVSGYAFYAGRVDSLAASFKAVLTTRNWLKMSGFNSLPIYMIPAGLTNEAFVKLVNTDRFPFKFPLISGYMIFEGIDYRYHPLNLIQHTVKGIKKNIDEQGYIKAEVTDTAGQVHIYQHSDAAHNGIQKGSLLVCKRDGKLIYSSTRNSAAKIIKVTCDSCGNTFICPESGPVCCSDPDCVSNMYPKIRKFMNTLALPILPYSQFKSYLDKKKVTCFADVFILPEYKSTKVECTLAKFIQAIVPSDVCSDSALFSKLATTCDNSVKTFLYYLCNGNRLKGEIDDKSLMANRLVDWLSDSDHALTISTLLEGNQITIKESGRKFDGAPIFRGKKIAITGKFKHGDVSEIISILQSYSAEVAVNISGPTDCLLIGDLRENIDGKSLQIARENSIPTFYESEFFAKYEIDSDLLANLL